MANVDIIARLQLRADQFASETGAQLAQFKTRAQSTAAEVKTSFGQSFAEVQKLAQQALTLPRTATGSLDLSGEIASLRQAATAADQKAAVERELAAAMLAASGSARTVTEAIRLEADAAMVAARASEADAGAIRQRILALEAVQIELNKTSGVTISHTRAANDNATSTSQQRQSMMMLGQQFQDFSVQAANGGSILTAFSQQVGQAGYALTGMGGRLGAVGAFLGTFTGSLTLVALTVLPALIGKILEHNNALDDAVDKLKKDAEQSDIARQAKDRFAASEEGVAAAIRDGTEATKKAIDARKSSAEQALDEAQKNLDLEISYRKATLAAIELAEAQSRQANASNFGAAGGAGAAAAQTIYRNQLGDLRKKAEDQRALIAAAEAKVLVERNNLAAEAAKRAVDPMARIKKLYDDQAAAAQNAADAEARRGRNVSATLQRELTAIETKRQAAIKQEQDRQSASRRSTSLGSQLASEQGGRILSSAQSYLGARENTTAGKATLRDLFDGAGISIDPEKKAWCAAFVNAVLGGQNIKGTGSLAARSFLNYGTATSRPEKGDIVVVRTGKTQEHVGFYAGQGAGGRVLVTGGNQSGGAVTTTSFARSSVEAFRRAPTASAEYAASLREQAKAAREAEEEQRKLDASLKTILGRLDPATEAARRYREELAQIEKLSAAGKITAEQGVSLTVAAKKDYNADATRAAEENFRAILGPEEVDRWVGQMQAGIDGAGEAMKQHLDEAAIRFGDQLGYVIGGVADLFGLRMSGPLRGLLQPGGIEGQAQDIAGVLTGALRNTGLKIDEESLGRLTDRIGGVLSSAAYGQIGGSVFASISGGKQSKAGSAIGGALGGEAGKELGKLVTKEIGGGLGKALGGAAGPLGAIAGGMLGSLVGGLFRKSISANASVSLNQFGSAVGGTGTGNDAGARNAASGGASSIAQGINRIADQLGATISNLPGLTIGSFDGKSRVALTNTSASLNYNNFNQSMLKDFGKDGQQAAIEYAIRYSIGNAVISGISQASRNIIQNGSADLESAISKAILIESVPKDLKSMLDPVGAAIDELNAKFKKTVDALKEGGASADQMAQAQRLYELQLQQVKNSTSSASQTLKDFLTALKVGSNSPYSLRDQEQTAKAALQPFLDQIRDGKSIDQSKFQSAASAYLDVERKLYGSSKDYFDALDAVQAATNKAISAIDNASPIKSGVESPFAKATADSAAKTAAAVQTGNEMTGDTNELLRQLVDQNARLLGAIGGSSGGFIGTARSFVA